MKRILCYGDSNTWGYEAGTGRRYPEDVRWTGVMQSDLGPGYTVIEDGLNGRTTAYDLGWKSVANGMDALGFTLVSQAPIDLAIVMLGTNDLNVQGALGFYKGLTALVRTIKNAQTVYNPSDRIFSDPEHPEILLISPVALGKGISEMESMVRDKYEDSLQFPYWTERVASELGVGVMHAGQFASVSQTDCVHIDPEGHRRLGHAVADRVRQILG